MRNEGSPELPPAPPLQHTFYSDDHTMAVQRPGFCRDSLGMSKGGAYERYIEAEPVAR